jgi:DNA-binding SARP family transcriptional activator
LSSELPPKRSRRAIELTAYLALNRPDPVTSDRLRTRVLGSADADAAAKTLFNVAAAARRAMGIAATGTPYLPPATRTGHYRISDEVTVDVERLGALVRTGRRTTDPEAASALLRAALELIEGEPLGATLSGYGWWLAEGHAGRVSTCVVEAATELARLSIEMRNTELGGWALDRARRVEPYSEVLSRAAMRWAAATGDADRLRREWFECQRRLDELDPGCLPSGDTEKLYAELVRQVSA